MKKIISALLALALCLALCACGNTDANGAEDTTTGAQTTETTENTTETTVQTESEEEKALKATQARYEKANEYLEKYLQDGYFRDDDWKYYENADALAYLYKEFEACGDYEDSAEIFSRFTVLPDMLTSITNTKTDNLGNAEKSTYKSYEYDEKGTSQEDPILEFLGVDGWPTDVQYEYDDTGCITCVKVLDYACSAIIRLEYDANGNIVKAISQTNTNTYTNTYTYDEQNRLIAAEKYEVAYDIGYLYSHTYTYDVNGNLAEDKYSYVGYRDYTYEYTITYSYYENGDLKKKEVVAFNPSTNFTSIYTNEYEYEYDTNGYLVMKKEIETILKEYYQVQFISQFLYTNDENGRPISAELTETEDGTNAYASQILTYNYETLYFYNAE